MDIHALQTRPSTHRRARFVAGILFRTVFVMAIAAALWWLVWSSVGGYDHLMHSMFLPASIVVVIGLFALRIHRRWIRPTARLLKLLPEILANQAAIEELSQIKTGGLKPLMPIMQDIFRELRRQKTEVAELREEMRNRVATRTNALERQIGSLRQQATRDVLTGLYNRRMLDGYLPQIVEKSVNEKIEVSLLMIDVDNFKILNDTLGHAAGDELLKNIGQIIRSGVREQDSPFRLGGDEFVIVLPGSSLVDAVALSKRLTALVDSLAKTLRAAPAPRLAIGVAALSELSDPCPRELVQLADKRLYEVKASRRPIQAKVA